jgi:hypothetical protein
MRPHLLAPPDSSSSPPLVDAWRRLQDLARPLRAHHLKKSALFVDPSNLEAHGEEDGDARNAQVFYADSDSPVLFVVRLDPDLGAVVLAPADVLPGSELVQCPRPILQVGRDQGHGQSAGDEAARDDDLCVELVMKMQQTR